MYFLGIDGGGTKTAFTLVDENLNVVSKIIKGTCHYNQIGFDNLEILLREGLEEICKKAKISIKDINYTFVGLAGYGRVKEIAQKIEKTVEVAFKDINYTLGNDVEIALAGSLNGEEGINIISGTGSISLALDKEGKLHRCGGWGYILGDEGSAYWIGLKLLKTFAMQSDGRCEKSKIYDLVKEKLNITNDYDIIKFINEDINGDRGKIAEFSMLCYDAAIDNDHIAIQIFKDAAYELARLVKALDKYFDKDDIVKVSYSGGIFKSNELILSPLKEYLNSNRFKIVKPELSPDLGACLLAKKKYYKLNHIY